MAEPENSETSKSETNFSPIVHHGSATPNLFDVVDDWFTIGYPTFQNLLNKIHEQEVIKDPLVKILVFNILGGFNHYFVKAMKEFEGDMTLAYHKSLSEMMSDPAIKGLINQFMGDKVSSQVGGIIENGEI